jgi:hypothetical protein
MNMDYTNLLTAVNFNATSVSQGNEIKEADNTNMQHVIGTEPLSNNVVADRNCALFVVTSIVVRKPNATSPLFITLTVI